MEDFLSIVTKISAKDDDVNKYEGQQISNDHIFRFVLVFDLL